MRKERFAMMKSGKKVQTAVLAAVLTLATSVPAFAATATEDIDAQIAEQEKILEALNAKKDKIHTDEMADKISSLQDQLKDLQEHKDSYDAEGAVNALATQIANLQKEFESQSATQAKLAATMDRLEKLLEKEKEDPASAYGSAALVNPSNAKKLSYTQDAKNAQGNSTMVFRYAPNQLYKIYCRVGYLTDIALHKGEKVSFVGGGDTSAWAISSATVDGTTHIYIKPTVETSTTNIIITTDKRSYQLIVNTSNWYNPMVTWTYGTEDQAKVEAQKDSNTGRLSAVDLNHLNFSYSIKGDSSYRPAMVFDDGEKTYVQFRQAPRRLPAVFLKERGHKNLLLSNFKSKNDTYIFDRLTDEIELRFSEDTVIHIKYKGKD